MRLQDHFSAARPFQVQTDDGQIHTLQGARAFSDAVAAAPVRYVLNDASVQLVAESAFDDHSMVGAAVDLLRIPADRVWIEWSDKCAQQVLGQLCQDAPLRATKLPRNVGVLIESTESGRSGEARMMWLSDEGEVELSPFIAEFDFDAPITCTHAGTDHTVRHVHIRGLEGLNPFFACVKYRLEPSWEQYYRTYCHSEAHFEQTVQNALTSVAGDFLFTAAFFLVLSTRTVFDERETTFEKLNPRRIKKGKSPLLDHVEVRLNLTPGERSGIGGSPDRSAPRLHHVTGHLVRRGDTLFWRRAHLRGNPSRGVVASKTIAVTAEPVPVAA